MVTQCLRFFIFCHASKRASQAGGRFALRLVVHSRESALADRTGLFCAAAHVRSLVVAHIETTQHTCSLEHQAYARLPCISLLAMAQHLSHKLPWNTLASTIVSEQVPMYGQPGQYYTRLKLRGHDVDDGRAAWKQMRHFARCLCDAVSKFAATDRLPEEERLQYDSSKWLDFKSQACLLPPASVLGGYILFNLFVSDASRWSSLVFGCRQLNAIECCLDQVDNGHPKFLADQCRAFFTATKQLCATHHQECHQYVVPTLDSACLEKMRDYVKELFRALMFSPPQHPDEMASNIAGAVGVFMPYPLPEKEEKDADNSSK